VAEPIRQVGISEQTPSRWKKQYKGLETDRVRSSSNLANCLKACIRILAVFPRSDSSDKIYRCSKFVRQRWRGTKLRRIEERLSSAWSSPKT
jgi:hypothetical protein